MHFHLNPCWLRRALQAGLRAHAFSSQLFLTPLLLSRALEAGLKVGYAAAFGMAVGTLPVCNELRGKKDSLPDAMSGACTGAAAGWAFYAGKPVSLIAQGTLGGAMLGFAIANQIRRNPGLFGLCECRIPSPKASIGTDDSSLEDEGEAEVLNRKVKYLNREIDNLKWTIR